jgi:Helix-turn-helix domain
MSATGGRGRNDVAMTGFAMADRRVITDPRLTPMAFRLWCLLNARQGVEAVYVKQQTLADDLGVTTKTIAQATQELESLGLVKVCRERGSTTYYQAINPSPHRGEDWDRGTPEEIDLYLSNREKAVVARQKRLAADRQLGARRGPRPANVGRQVPLKGGTAVPPRKEAEFPQGRKQSSYLSKSKQERSIKQEQASDISAGPSPRGVTLPEVDPVSDAFAVESFLALLPAHLCPEANVKVTNLLAAAAALGWTPDALAGVILAGITSATPKPGLVVKRLEDYSRRPAADYIKSAPRQVPPERREARRTALPAAEVEPAGDPALGAARCREALSSMVAATGDLLALP